MPIDLQFRDFYYANSLSNLLVQMAVFVCTCRGHPSVGASLGFVQSLCRNTFGLSAFVRSSALQAIECAKEQGSAVEFQHVSTSTCATCETCAQCSDFPTV